MAPTDKAGRVIFIGNIPYGLTEEQVQDLFATCGKVLNFRIVYDKDTGRPKGFGFLEFSSADEAASAVRNLNNHDVMGRNLRVDYSNEAGGGDAGGGNTNKHEQQSHQQAEHWQKMQAAQQQNQQQQPPQPPQHYQQPQQQQMPPIGVPLPDNVSAPDAISRTLSAMDPNELLTVISHLKTMANTEPQQVNSLFTQQPQLAYAVFQALVQMGLVDATVLNQLIDTSRPQALPPQPPPQPTPLPFQPPPQQQHYAPPQSVQPPHFPPHFQQPTMMGTPPVHHQGYPPPPMPQLPQRPPGMTDENWESIRHLCMMPQQQVDMMADPNQRNQILGLRQQYGHFFQQPQPQQYRPMGY